MPVSARIVHAASNVAPGSGSTFTMVPRLCALLQGMGFDVTLVSADECGGHEGAALRNGFPTLCFARSWAGAAFGISEAYRAELARLQPSMELLHVHGLWRRSGIEALRAAKRAKAPVILSPMGLLSPEALKLSALRKFAYWHLFQGRLLEGVSCYHATSHAEHDHLREFGINAPIAVIPLGCDIPEYAPPAPKDGARTVLCLGRISPIKNLRSLIGAWRSLQGEFGDAQLRIVGPDDRGHAGQLEAFAATIGARQISIEPGVWGEAWRSAFIDSHLAIVPSLSESFGLVVAEALAIGRPVITTTGTPWRALQDANCGWWVDHRPEGLAKALREALTLPAPSLTAMGARGRTLAIRQLSWTHVLPKFRALYEWALGQSPRPDFVTIGHRGAKSAS